MSRQPLCVVVATPDPELSSSLAESLESVGHMALDTSDAEEVLLLPRPDVLVLSLELEGGGLALLEELRARGTSPPTVLISELPSLTDYRMGMRHGARDLLTMPLMPGELVRAVNAIAGSDPGTELLRAYDATAASVGRAARDLGAWLMRRGVTPAARCRITSAVAEAVDNAASHAYTADLGPVEVYARLDGRELTVIVRDHGVGMGPEDVSPNQLDDTQRGGLARMCALSEDLCFESTDEGVRVRMKFTAHHVRFDCERGEDLSDLDYLTPKLARAVLSNLTREDGGEPLHLSPALAVCVGRLLNGPDPRRILETSLWS